MDDHAGDGSNSVTKHDSEEFVRIANELQDHRLSTVCIVCRCCACVLAVILLLPIRIVLALVVLVLIWLVSCMSICAGCRQRGGKLAPHTRAQCWILWLNTPLYRLLLFCFGVLWIRVRRPKPSHCKAPELQSHANATVVANHVSTLDFAVLAVLFGCQLTGVAIRWVTRMPFMSTLTWAHHVLDVSRPRTAKVAPEEDTESSKPPRSATDTIVDYQRACASNSQLLPLMLFPEGTTKAARCLLKFRTGAFVSGEPVQPVALHYWSEFAWVGSTTRHIFRMLTHWGCVVEVTVLPVYVPNDAEKADPTLYANNVQAVLAGALRLPAERVSTQIGAKELFSLAS